MKQQLKKNSSSKSYRVHYSRTNKKSNSQFLLVILLSAVIIGLIIVANLAINTNTESRSRAYQQTNQGVSIEGEEMQISGDVTIDANNAVITFGM